MSEGAEKKHGGARPGSGRKPAGTTAVSVAMRRDLIKRIDAWRKDSNLSRPAAIRLLTMAGLCRAKEVAELVAEHQQGMEHA